MHIALLTNIISPHQLPLAKRLAARVGEGNYTYVYTEPLHEERRRMGWEDELPPWAVLADENHPALWEADILYSELRAIDLFQKRIRAGKKTYYVSERWFKPPWGFLRTLSPRYFQMARAFHQLFQSPHFHYLPQGIHAARDMARLMRFLDGAPASLLAAPPLAFESRPGGAILPLPQASSLHGLDSHDLASTQRRGFLQLPPTLWGQSHPTGLYAQMHLWGYFVEPSDQPPPAANSAVPPHRILWAGRMLDWKRVDTLVHACLPLTDVHLDLYGHGPEEAKLRRLARNRPDIAFHDNVPIHEMRALMRAHDLYVLPSDATEGWGAVVNEALAERLPVLATAESGAGATVLPPSCLFPAGNAKKLRRLIRQPVQRSTGGFWDADSAADAFLKLAETHLTQA
jgi:glycosyltransferase involved in cell wall biosynthesis